MNRAQFRPSMPEQQLPAVYCIRRWLAVECIKKEVVLWRSGRVFASLISFSRCLPSLGRSARRNWQTRFNGDQCPNSRACTRGLGRRRDNSIMESACGSSTAGVRMRWIQRSVADRTGRQQLNAEFLPMFFARSASQLPAAVTGSRSIWWRHQS